MGGRPSAQLRVRGEAAGAGDFPPEGSETPAHPGLRGRDKAEDKSPGTERQ